MKILSIAAVALALSIADVVNAGKKYHGFAPPSVGSTNNAPSSHHASSASPDFGAISRGPSGFFAAGAAADSDAPVVPKLNNPAGSRSQFYTTAAGPVRGVRGGEPFKKDPLQRSPSGMFRMRQEVDHPHGYRAVWGDVPGAGPKFLDSPHVARLSGPPVHSQLRKDNLLDPVQEAQREAELNSFLQRLAGPSSLSTESAKKQSANSDQLISPEMEAWREEELDAFLFRHKPEIHSGKVKGVSNDANSGHAARPVARFSFSQLHQSIKSPSSASRIAPVAASAAKNEAPAFARPAFEDAKSAYHGQVGIVVVDENGVRSEVQGAEGCYKLTHGQNLIEFVDPYPNTVAHIFSELACAARSAAPRSVSAYTHPFGGTVSSVLLCSASGVHTEKLCG